MPKPAHLTIDDSASAYMEERVLELAKRGIQAVWFCRGDHLSERPQAAIQALHAGQILGNHSWDHPRFSTLTLEQARDQIDRTDALLDSLHRKAGVPRKVKLFRFPYEDRIGSPEHHEALQELLRSRGFVLPRIDGVESEPYLRHVAENDVSMFWTYDTEDWTLPSPVDAEAGRKLTKVLERMDRDDPMAGCGLAKPGREVVIMHDHDHTAGLWQVVLQGLLSQGLQFQPLV
ncbi:MAG TPA: polysaccharide deacetylase family protein [Fibrobacteria bacterium]|nr:polysaccharide deacetylase family protein [Fibrobacteria bacterium]